MYHHLLIYIAAANIYTDDYKCYLSNIVSKNVSLLAGDTDDNAYVCFFG